MPNELTNPNNVVTEERLAQFYQQILPYLGGMPDVLANKFNRADLYSTDEKLIGRWIDGKPLYQKTVTGTTPSGSSWGEIADIGSTCHIVQGQLYVIASSNQVNPIPFGTGNIRWAFNFYNVNGKVAINPEGDADFTSKPCYAIVRYTKTTDSAVEIGDDTDYSTTEKIVGTWIDGKPIWQKTVNFGALPNNSSKTVSTGVNNIDNICNLFGLAKGDSEWRYLPYSSGDLTYVISLDVQGSDIRIITKRNYSDMSAYVTIQYTKTSS